MNHWWYFLLGVIVAPFLRVLALALNRAVIEHRQKRLLKLVNVHFPDQDNITFISIDANDKRAMAKLERQIREQYDVPEGEDDRGDRERRRGPDRAADSDIEDPPR